MAKHRWAMSGTPVQNGVEELYPYFKFLRVRHTGSAEVFRQNFCDPENEYSNPRLHCKLKDFMIRRTHKDELLNAPIVQLPRNHQNTIEVEFNIVERAIYNMVRARFIQKINLQSAAGNLEKSFRNVLVNFPSTYILVLFTDSF